MSIVAYLLLSFVLLHPAQESLAELRFNEKTQRVEVALRLSIADEQHLLRPASTSPTGDVLRDSNELQKAALAVLGKRLRFGAKDDLTDAALPAESEHAYEWIGRQTEGAHVWWYFTHAGTPDQITHLRCTLFAASDGNDIKSRSANAHDHLHAEPVSTFVVLHPKQTSEQKSFTTKREKPTHKIEW